MVQSVRNNEDHPRVCGEYYCAFVAREFMLGSPPRVRGIPNMLITMPSYDRITPACAGNTLNAISCDSEFWDHPRVCGEYFFLMLFFPFQKGSPPRVRGILLLNVSKKYAIRITPACAGNTCTSSYR